MSFDDATRAQVEAARPDLSTWLEANAGSGKTRVLTDRVARLLLSGVEPQRILCLTYTKAAASEMQIRLFRRLGSWAMLEDAALRDEMGQLGIEESLDDQALRKARRLFALAIETPGGLKIQTIHSFCASLLRRFPLEAGVNPQFSEIDDRSAELLRAEIVEQMAEGEDTSAIADLALVYTGEDFSRLTQRIVGLRALFENEVTQGDLLRQLGHAEDLSVEQIEASVFTGGEQTLLTRIVPKLVEKGGNDAKAGTRLSLIQECGFTDLPLLETVFLTGEKAKAPFSAKVGSFPTKVTKAIIEKDLPALEAFMLRVEAAREQRLAVAAAQKTEALHQFARFFLRRYEIAKQARGWLDFDDLITKARALLLDPKVAAWVLYRIDGGIDHILVDEAQDTSPHQWDVVEKLTDEFTSGSGARTNVDRTLFVVGDKKQSIYSFQGADPTEFDRKADLFENKIRDSGGIFQRRSLDFSFRSSSAVLRFVDTVFDPMRRSDLSVSARHIAFKSSLPGRVDLWPAIEASKGDDTHDWTDPVDRRSPQHHWVTLANQIADQIAQLTTEPHYIPDDGPDKAVIRRRIQPGDFLILVQRRGGLFAEIIRACKAKNLEIAGADRLKVGAELAVKDIACLLAFLATPDDSLSLATALKSPLFGWSEQDLFTLAHGRTTPELWATLRTEEQKHPKTVSVLRDLRAQVDFLRPYDLIERILTRHGGRARLLARLGVEAEDGINAMLSQALNYERSAIPSLTGFIEWLRTDDLEIKRQIDSASNQIRVMTVHGSKGLEAPIVILPDTGKRDITVKDEIIQMGGLPFWKPASGEAPQKLRAAIEGIKSAERAERTRLLYVAMTRAEKWLMVAVAGDLARDRSDWYQIMQDAMGHVNGTEVPGSKTVRFEEGHWDDLPITENQGDAVAETKLEPCLTETAPVFAHPTQVLSPSELGGEKVLLGDANAVGEDARAYGTMVHTLMEMLPSQPADTWEQTALSLLGQSDPATAQKALHEALACLLSPNMSELFAEGTLSEVPITGNVGGQRLHGVLDRLIIEPDRVLLVDYKTNQHVPTTAGDCPEGILRQMGAYATLLEQIYPDHRIQTAILWTKTAELMHLPHDIVTAALWRSPYLDAVDARS